MPKDVTVTQFFCNPFRKKHSNLSVIIIIELHYFSSTRVLVNKLLLNSIALYMFTENQLGVVAGFQGYHLSTYYEVCISMHGMDKGSILTYVCMLVVENSLYAF